MSKPSQPFPLRNSAIGYMCASFQMSRFLTRSSTVFPLAHRNMRISVVCNFLSSFFLTAQHSAPYTMAGFTAVFYTFSTLRYKTLLYVNINLLLDYVSITCQIGIIQHNHIPFFLYPSDSIE